jgi:membrane carboxypeptidase/penicillin-binding protein PbpC
MAIKTGTSEPYAETLAIGDTWAIGYTPQLVFGSWFGNADNAPMAHNVSSTYVSWHTVRDFMSYYHEDLPVESFTVPEGLARAKVCVPSGLKPTDNCPITTTEDLFAAHALPQIEDNWWTKARIDTRTGKLASELTPEEFVKESFYLNLPKGLSEWERIQAEEWARSLNASTEEAPTEVTEEPDIPRDPPTAIITSPVNTAYLVRGIVTITGRATSSDFLEYSVEYGLGTNPTAWTVINRSTIPVADGTLARWHTSTLEQGSYTIRLIVQDAERGQIATHIQINLLATAPASTPAPAATPGP